MTVLVTGGNAALPSSTAKVVATAGLDLTALVVTGDKVDSDDDMVFFNQPSQPGVTWQDNIVSVDLTALRPGASKVVLLASPATDGTTFGSLAPVSVTVESGSEAITFTPSGLTNETALILVELYERNGQYKVRAVGQGYASGLAGVATDFGITVDDAPAPATEVPAAPLNLTKPPLGRIDLTKKGTATIPIDFTKQSLDTLTFTVHLDWDGGSVERREVGADLDLYALYALKDGSVGIEYYNTLSDGSRQSYVRLLGDAQEPGRETVIITRPDLLAHVAICAYSAVGNGAGSFKSYGAKAIIDDGRGSAVTVPLFDNSERYWVHITTVSFTADGASITQAEDYGQPTESRPVLHPDGRVEMGAGPAEFKDIDLDKLLAELGLEHEPE